MAREPELIVQLPRGSTIDTHLREETPASVSDGRVLLQHLTGDQRGRLQPPEAGEIVLTVPSPESLRAEPDEVLGLIGAAAADGGPLVVLVEGAEYLRDDQLAPVLAAAAGTGRTVILRILEGV